MKWNGAQADTALNPSVCAQSGRSVSGRQSRTVLFEMQLCKAQPLIGRRQGLTSKGGWPPKARASQKLGTTLQPLVQYS